MSDFDDDYDYLRTDDPRDAGLDERRAIAWMNRAFPVTAKHDAPVAQQADITEESLRARAHAALDRWLDWVALAWSGVGPTPLARPDLPRDVHDAVGDFAKMLYKRAVAARSRCDIPLDGPSAVHSEMAENGDLDEHVTTRHQEADPQRVTTARTADNSADGYVYVSIGWSAITVFLEPAEEGGYVASVAMRPGCISQGETVPEALENLADAWRELDLAERS
jgi:hypothetical protein